LVAFRTISTSSIAFRETRKLEFAQLLKALLEELS